MYKNQDSHFGAEESVFPAPSSKTIFICALTLSLIFNLIAALKFDRDNVLYNSIREIDVNRPEVLILVTVFLITGLAITSYGVFCIIIFRIVFWFALKNDFNLLKKYLLTYTVYGYLIVAVWNFFDKIVIFSINPLVINIPISNIFSYLFIGVLYYKFLLPNKKVFIAPLVLICILTFMNLIGEFWI